VWWKILLGFVAAIVIAVSLISTQVNVSLGWIQSFLFGIGSTPDESTIQSRLTVPEGFSVGIYAANVNGVRFIEFTDAGDLVVAQIFESNVVLLKRDKDQDGRADGKVILLENLIDPSSIDFHEGYLYVAESNAVGRIKFDHASGSTIGDYERIITGLTNNGLHTKKTIRFGPDGLLYMSSGSTCNVCNEKDDRRAAITRYQPDGSGEQRYATGLRNAVGFDWSPIDGELYATDNGRDLLGNDYPPCELNRIEEGKFYGWPYINGFGDLDPDMGDESKLAEATSPVHGFRAHNAPLGIRFLKGADLPEEYKGAALVALHGSWNRAELDGYKVVSLHRSGDEGNEIVEKDFLAGFEKDGDFIGRPVDIAEGPDGCIYVSDDHGMAIYRVCYGIKQLDASLATQVAEVITETGLESFDEAQLKDLRTRGEQLFRTRGCVGCHAVNVEKPAFGMRLLKDLSSTHNVTTLRTLYKSPKPPMPPVRLANKEEELELSAYLLSL
jgi:glucose/arabinose dehydrogenase